MSPNIVHVLVFSFFTLGLFNSGCGSLLTRSENAPAQGGQTQSGASIKNSTETQPQVYVQKTLEQSNEGPQATAEYHFSLAQAYVAEGNPDRAIEEYKVTLMHDPNSALVHARIAAEYVKKGMLSQALESCKEALKIDPKYVDARLMLAGLYSSTHETDQALAQYEMILKDDPANEEALVYQSQVYIEESQPEKAVHNTMKFLKKNPDSALAWYYLGRGQQKTGAVQEAAKSYRKAMEFRPGFSQAGLALGFLYEEQKLNEQALKVYKELYETSSDVSAASRIATIYLKTEKYKEAIPFLESVESADGDDLNIKVKLGLVYMEVKNYDKAVRVFQDILNKHADSDRIHYYLGSIYEETKRPNEAITQLKKIKPDSKLYPDAVLHIAFMQKTQGSAQSARETMQEAIQKMPHVSGFYIFVASLDEDSKDFSGAVKTLETARELFPEDEKVLYYLGSLYDRMGDPDRSLVLMEMILRVNANNVDALNYIGYTWTTRGVRLNDAEKLLKRAVALKPDNGYIQDSWGWHLYVRGRVKEAVVELEKAARLKPKESTILEHLGDAYARANLMEKAARQYEQAIACTEESQSKVKLTAKLEQIKIEIAASGRSGRGVSPNSSKVERVPAAQETARAPEDIKEDYKEELKTE